MARYQRSSSISVFQIIKQLAKSIEVFIYEMTLIREEVRIFRKTNIAFSKRCKTKRIYIQAGGAFNIGDILGLIK